MDNSKTEVAIIKKYPNRRLYNTQISSYITLQDLFEMVQDNVTFKVIDTKTDEDLTRNILTQIILEQESKGYNLLPETFLISLIKLYGSTMGKIFPEYLENSMKIFNCNNDNSKEFYNPSSFFQEISKQNMKFLEQAMGSFFNNKKTEK